MRWLRNWGPAMAWAGAIWVLSTSLFSAKATSRYLIPLLSWLLPHAQQETLNLLHGVIRKTAHFGEYFIFSLLLLRGIRGDRLGWRLTWGLAALAIAACYAALDEVHQAFVPSRGPSPFDVLLDSSGAIVAQVWARWRAGRRRGSVDSTTTPTLP